LRSRPLAEKIAITRQFKERFWPLLEEGRIQPVIDAAFPIEEAQAAHAYVRENRNIGKVILDVGTEEGSVPGSGFSPAAGQKNGRSNRKRNVAPG
jgi:hypothetical protein